MTALRFPRLFASLLTSFAVLGVSASANAYCRTKACDTEASYGDVWDEEPDPEQCLRNVQGCFIEGEPLYWPSNCMSFGVQRDGSASSNIDFETAHAFIEEAFEKWAAADCGGETPGFRIVSRGEISCERAEYNQDATNANVFMFRDGDWPYAGGIDTLALTTITFNVETAEIYDADVEMNCPNHVHDERRPSRDSLRFLVGRHARGRPFPRPLALGGRNRGDARHRLPPGLDRHARAHRRRRHRDLRNFPAGPHEQIVQPSSWFFARVRRSTKRRGRMRRRERLARCRSAVVRGRRTRWGPFRAPARSSI